MTTDAQTTIRQKGAAAAPVLALENKKPQGPWADAYKRLMRNRMAVLGLTIILMLIFCAIFADKLALKGYADQVLKDNSAVPGWLPSVFTTVRPIGTEGGYAKINDSYPFGADALGRDILSRLLYGARISLSVAFIGPVTAILIGIIVGSIAGFYGGRLDNIMMRLVDLMYAFPTILLVILMMAYFRASFNQSAPGTFSFAMNRLDSSFGGLFFVFIAIGLTAWMNMARLTRGQVLSVREREFVMAAQSIGLSKRAIMLRHILPNIIGPLIVAETLTIPAYISFEAFLSFIGLGANPPTPSWGSMIASGAQAIRSYPNQAIFPALALALAMFAFNFLGDGLRDALDPRMRGVQ
jgi:oligopeptide transport system permease protein